MYVNTGFCANSHLYLHFTIQNLPFMHHHESMSFWPQMRTSITGEKMSSSCRYLTTICLALAVACCFNNSTFGDVLYDADFSTLADGPLGGQDGWEAQAGWTATGGIVSNSGSWDRARQFSAFAMQPGDVVRLTTEMSFSGTPGTPEFALFGFAKSDEHTGAAMPQVAAAVSWSGTNLSIGGVVDNGYDDGDTIQMELTFTMGANTNEWQMNVRLNNLTDGTSFEGGSSPADLAGSITPDTAWEALNAGGNALFGMRMTNNTGGVTVSLSDVISENNLPPEPPLGQTLVNADFCTFTDGALGGQGGFEGQPDWTITGGMATISASWSRARNIASSSLFNLQVGDRLAITANMSFSGTPGPEEFVRIGFSKNNEHTGAVIAPVSGGATWVGSELSIGGATDTGYDDGDELAVSMIFTRGAALNEWLLETTIENITDGTMFEGSTAPADAPGTVTTETVWEWMDAGNSGGLGMRGWNNTGGVTTSIKTLTVEKNPVTDPGGGGDFFVETLSVINGINSGGFVGDLDDSDNVDFTLRRNQASVAAICEIEIQSTSAVDSPTQFDLTVEASAFYRTEVIESISMFDYDAGSFEIVASEDASRFVDSVVVGSGTGDLSRFVEDGTGAVLARVRFRSSVPRQSFSVSIDQIFWTIN